MTNAEAIRQKHEEIASKFGPRPTVFATVLNLDPIALTCTLENDDGTVQYPMVRLRPAIDGLESITLFPKIGTWCIAVRIENDQDWMAIAFGEIDGWKLTTGNSVMRIDDNGFLVKNGTDNLHDAISLIITAVSQIMVAYGNNPDYLKLQQAQTMVDNLLKSA